MRLPADDLVAATSRASASIEPRPVSRCVGPKPRRRRIEARGLYRIFAPAEYRFYRSLTSPPVDGSVPFATSATLPATPAETFADGEWYLAVSYFNGVLDSGFLPFGAAGETYVRLRVGSGADLGTLPAGLLEWRVEQQAGGVVRVVAVCYLESAAADHEWAIAYSVDGSDPAADAPDVTAELTAGGLAVLMQDLPAAADGATVKVRLQIRRNDGTDESPVWSYSAASTIKSILADATGPTAAIAAEAWAGELNETAD